MDAVVFATKGNLMSSQRSLQLAKTGFELMDKKRNILIREMMLLVNKANAIQEQIDAVFSEAYQALQAANVSAGVVEHIAEAVPIDNSVRILMRSVMGVEVPVVSGKDEDSSHVPYSLFETSATFDEAYVNFKKVKQLCRELAEVENSVYRLAIAIKKTQRRANALKNIVIPRLETTIKFISESLEEKEREEFSRLKVIKKQKTE